MQAQRLFDTLEELSTCNATPGNRGDAVLMVGGGQPCPPRA